MEYFEKPFTAQTIHSSSSINVHYNFPLEPDYAWKLFPFKAFLRYLLESIPLNYLCIPIIPIKTSEMFLIYRLAISIINGRIRFNFIQINRKAIIFLRETGKYHFV